MQATPSNRKYLEGTAADQNATKWDFYVSSRIREIDRETAKSRHESRQCYQVVNYENDRPATILSIDHGFDLHIYRQFRWDESAALNVSYFKSPPSQGPVILSSFTWFAYQSLHLHPVYRVDVLPKVDGRVYRLTRNLITGQNTSEEIRIDTRQLDGLWLEPPEFDEYEELRRWHREPVVSMAAELLQHCREKWGLV
jgi:hypothetical protein